MSSTEKLKTKEHCPGPGTESRTLSLSRSVQQNGQSLQPSGSNASAKPQGEKKKESFHPDSSSFSGASVLDIPIPSPQSIIDRWKPVNGMGCARAQAISMHNHGNHNRLHVGDDISGNKGIIGHHNVLVQQFYNSAQTGLPEGPISLPNKFRSLTKAIVYIEATEHVLGALFGNVTLNSFMSPEFEQNGPGGNNAEEYVRRLIGSIKSIIEKDDPSVAPSLRDQLKNLRGELRQARKRLFDADDDFVAIETASLAISSRLKLFLFVNHMDEYIPSTVAVTEVKNRMEAHRNTKAAGLRILIKDLPCAKAAYDDYVSIHQRRVSCFKGTRKALLKEMGEWVAKAETSIFALSGLAGIGKSTIAQTVAERADNVGLLGASFFFSRDEVERRTAEKFFTTIAFQLCVHDPEFASAIESILKTEQGKAAIMKHPMEQLGKLILEPLTKLAPRRVLIVVDALDECNEEDGPTVLKGLHKLVQNLPSFKVVLTTRPQQHFQLLLDGEGPQKVFHLHNIEDKVVDGDIRLYLKHHLSRETVQECFQDPLEEWNASDDEIESLVKAAGRLFIIASTSVLFVLDKAAHDPENRMQQLLDAIADGKTPFEALNNFYTVILRSALPKGCDLRAVARYQSVVGAIMLIQTPLPVEQLAKLIGYQPMDVRRVLAKLQPVILIDDPNHVLRVYHKSFPDFLQDPARCKDEDLRIDIKVRHTGMAVNCFMTMNQLLRQNIFELGGLERFMDNVVLRKCYIPEDMFEAIFSFELRYACTFWVNHIKGSDMEEQTLVDNLEIFVNEHLLHWFEALSWIGQLGSAHRSLLTLQKQLKSTSSNLSQLVTDGFRFIAKFYEIIKRSALHTYHSALPFTPTETSLYGRYSKQVTFCQVQGWQDKWDALITKVSVGSSGAERLVFSSSSKMFACLNDHNHRDSVSIYEVGGIPIGRIGEGVTAIANDFSKVAVADDSSITLYKVKGLTPVATIKSSTTVFNLALSPDGSRLVAGLRDDTVDLWDTEKCQLINSFDGWKKWSGVTYSSDGKRIAFRSCDGTVKILDGRTGRVVAEPEFLVLQKATLMFSGDGSRLACLSGRPIFGISTFRLWRSEDGALIGMAEACGRRLIISTDGSLLVIGERDKLELWSGNNLALLDTLDLANQISSIAISQDGFLGIGFYDHFVSLYDINNRTFIAWLPLLFPTSLAFSPDCTRLAAGSLDGDVNLLDMLSITASYSSSQQRSSAPTQLVFSPDCSRLASGHEDGVIKLWDTSNPTRPISIRKGHPTTVTALAFSIDDNRTFASGSMEGIVRLWKDKDWMGRKGAPSASLKYYGEIKAVALSKTMLAAILFTHIALWDLNTRAVVATLNQYDTQILTLSNQDCLLATATHHTLTLWDIGSHTQIASFNIPSIINMTISADCSRLAAQCDTGADRVFPFPVPTFRLFSIRGNKVAENEDLALFGLWPFWRDFPVWLQNDDVVARSPQRAETVTVLYKPNSLDVQVSGMGSSMIALGCKDGRILLIKPI